MVQPIILDLVAQIFLKHYNNEPKQAAENAMKFLEIIDLYGLQIIKGDWQQKIKDKPKSPWELMLENMDEAAEREPWLAWELNHDNGNGN